eukprot:gene25869-biopygen11006
MMGLGGQFLLIIELSPGRSVSIFDNRDGDDESISWSRWGWGWGWGLVEMVGMGFGRDGDGDDESISWCFPVNHRGDFLRESK